MVNRSLFQSLRGLVPTGRNQAGGSAHLLDDKHALAQLAVTGCFGDVFYANATQQLTDCLKHAQKVDDAFLAQLAVYARESGAMKDMPALLCALLTQRKSEHLEAAFARVINSTKMLRNYVQIVRSGVTGRRSFGSRPKRLIKQWLEGKDANRLFLDDVGQQPSLADIIKMVHPTPVDPEREALYGYLLGKPVVADALPELVKEFEAYKQGLSQELPDLPFQRLSSLKLGTQEWVSIAKRATWTMTRMNLNTFARHGVFSHPGLTELVAKRLANPELVRKARPFPYQLLVAYAQTGQEVPGLVKLALQDAMEIATENVPRLDGHVGVLVDVSGSMASPATGYRKGATTAVRCVDVAGLMASCILRQNPSAVVVPFDTQVHGVCLNPRDTVLTNAATLARFGGGGTDCSVGLYDLAKRSPFDLVVMISDNQSWINSNAYQTHSQTAWQKIKAKNLKAKLVCLDIQPYTSSQVPNQSDVLNIGGFSDLVFKVIADFAKGQNAADWVREIESITI